MLKTECGGESHTHPPYQYRFTIILTEILSNVAQKPLIYQWKYKQHNFIILVIARTNGRVFTISIYLERLVVNSWNALISIESTRQLNKYK